MRKYHKRRGVNRYVNRALYAALIENAKLNNNTISDPYNAKKMIAKKKK